VTKYAAITLSMLVTNKTEFIDTLPLVQQYQDHQESLRYSRS
jgi:hypothetical protein